MVEIGTYATLRVRADGQAVTASIRRPESRNSLSAEALRELHAVLDEAERDPHCRVMILEGQPGVFCTGMDFREMFHAEAPADAARVRELDSLYMSLLKRFSLTSKIIVAKVDGQVMAGGVGLVAASDVAIATERTLFSLSEALWGLLPACVTPFLIRRVGFQKAYWMTLTSQSVSARDALAMHLVDEVSDDLDDAVRRALLRLCRPEDATVRELKAYFRRMWILDAAMEDAAVDEITRLVLEPRVRDNIRNFVEHRRFPWERRS